MPFFFSRDRVCVTQASLELMVPLPLSYEVGPQWVTIPSLHTFIFYNYFYHSGTHEEVRGQLPGVVFLLPPWDLGTELTSSGPFTLGAILLVPHCLLSNRQVHLLRMSPPFGTAGSELWFLRERGHLNTLHIKPRKATQTF